jgi:hypothetical protein
MIEVGMRYYHTTLKVVFEVVEVIPTPQATWFFVKNEAGEVLSYGKKAFLSKYKRIENE